MSYSAKLASQYSLSLIEASRDPFVTISPKGKITDINQTNVNITDIAREKLTGTDFLTISPSRKKREKYIKKCLQKVLSLILLLHYVTKMVSERMYYLTALYIKMKKTTC